MQGAQPYRIRLACSISMRFFESMAERKNKQSNSDTGIYMENPDAGKTHGGKRGSTILSKIQQIKNGSALPHIYI